MKTENRPPKHSQIGITLIESLIAIVLTALGILGILGVQMRTLTDTSTTVRRAQAIRLIEDLSERLKTNPNSLAKIGDYASNFANTPATTNCTAACNNDQLVAYQLAEWKKAVRDQLPAGQASIFIPPAEDGIPSGQRRQLGIIISWRENERDILESTYKDSKDATKILNESGTLVSGGGSDKTKNACPDNSTCHLQYIPVQARCAPYQPGGSGALLFYCPGY